MTVEQLSTSNISSTCPTGVNYISKYAGDLREKSHEVWTRNSNRSRCTAKKMTGGPPPPPNGIRVNTKFPSLHGKPSKAVFIIFLKLETRFNTHYQNAYANAFRKAFLELLRLSSNSIASTSREEGLVTAQLLCAVWPVEQRSRTCRARAFT